MYRGKEDAKTALQLSEHGKACIVVVYGHSLAPIIKPFEAVVVEPLANDRVIGKGDIIFCRLRKRFCIRLVIGHRKSERYSVGNSRGAVNGMIGRGDVYGVAVRILRRKIPP